MNDLSVSFLQLRPTIRRGQNRLVAHTKTVAGEMHKFGRLNGMLFVGKTAGQHNQLGNLLRQQKLGELLEERRQELRGQRRTQLETGKFFHRRYEQLAGGCDVVFVRIAVGWMLEGSRSDNGNDGRLELEIWISFTKRFCLKCRR